MAVNSTGNFPVAQADHGVLEPDGDGLLALDASPGGIHIDRIVGVEVRQCAESIGLETLVDTASELVIAVYEPAGSPGRGGDRESYRARVAGARRTSARGARHQRRACVRSRARPVPSSPTWRWTRTYARRCEQSSLLGGECPDRRCGSGRLWFREGRQRDVIAHDGPGGDHDVALEPGHDGTVEPGYHGGGGVRAPHLPNDGASRRRARRHRQRSEVDVDRGWWDRVRVHRRRRCRRGGDLCAPSVVDLRRTGQERPGGTRHAPDLRRRRRGLARPRRGDPS